jgi:hypothetical protein
MSADEYDSKLRGVTRALKMVASQKTRVRQEKGKGKQRATVAEDEGMVAPSPGTDQEDEDIR